MRRLLALLLALLPITALSTLPVRATLEELAKEADHVLIGRVIDVDMIDSKGAQITDLQARTGPGLGTQIRLTVKVDEVLASTSKEVPPSILVPLDPAMHFSLGQIRAAHSKVSPPMLVLLKGDRFQPIRPGLFLRSLADREATLKFRAITR